MSEPEPQSNARLLSGIFLGIWYVAMVSAAYNGFFEILAKFSSRPDLWPRTENNDAQTSDGSAYEGVTIIRPIKGVDPELASCLESSFCQNYPSDKLQILFCVDNPRDEAVDVIKTLLARYPHINASILVSSNYNECINSSVEHYGPNPKVNNLAKGFNAAIYDILWVMDSNVWASPNILRNSIMSLNHNYNNGRKLSDVPGARRVKLVHHVPLALSINSSNNSATDSEYSLSPVISDDSQDSGSSSSVGLTSTPLFRSRKSLAPNAPKTRRRFLKKWGAKLDEMFLFTSHAKFYVSLNNLAIAPCVNGKSNIYRKSDLDKSVELIASPKNNSAFFNNPGNKRDASYFSSLPGLGNSIKFFARYIGEDNMIGIALWENVNGKTGLTGDIVVQPLSGQDNSAADYITRRVRWLRVRKYMVLMATLVEPTTESIICGIYGTYAFSTMFLGAWWNWKFFTVHMILWMITDYTQYYTLAGNVSKATEHMPRWLENIPPMERPWWQWAQIWLMREVLALPIWLIAMFGHEIDWRGKPFKIKQDLTAEEL